MIIIDNFLQVTAQIESERGISKEMLISAIEQALASACRRHFPEDAVLQGKVNPETGEAKIYRVFDVVTKVETPGTQLTTKEAKKMDSKAKAGTQVLQDITPENFGRIAAQTAKQVIIQRIREAEKNAIYEAFKPKEGDIVYGSIQRIEGRHYLINLGRGEAILPYKEQIPGENFGVKDKARVVILSVEKDAKGAHILLSRAHPKFLSKLFELEIPEIQDGIISIMSVAREPGVRAKVAVKSTNPLIGAVGTCVGHMGNRIQAIIKELGQEKIDVLEWSENPKTFISNALKPAKISNVVILNEEEKSAIVVVPLDQLSLAIGKAGVNVRLSVKLTGWKLDIMSEEEYAKKADEIHKKTHVSIVDKIKQEKAKNKEKAASEAAKGDVARTKVSDLAKELGMKTADLMEKVKGFGVFIKSNRALLTDAEVSKIKGNIS